MDANDPIIKDLVRTLSVGGGINILSQAPIIGYNPDVQLEWTTNTPYQLIIHERFRGKHLIQIIDLDDYKGEAVRIRAQEISTAP